MLLVGCYQYYKKRVNNRVGNLDQNQRLVAGTTNSTTVTTTTTKNHGNLKAVTSGASGNNSNNNNNHKGVSGSASKIKSKDPHGVVRPLRQTSTDKNKAQTTEVTNEGNLVTTTDSPRFNMAANQPGAITMFNSQHLEHLENEQKQHGSAPQMPFKH
uniref:Uncharacterized protein n=1 Tax=Panagrolaimus davidi TaxID=227884 RepID=A0A914PI36_9BILA